MARKPLIQTRGRTTESLRAELVQVWLVREVSDDWLVRFDARPKVALLQRIIAKREKTQRRIELQRILDDGYP